LSGKPEAHALQVSLTTSWAGRPFGLTAYKRAANLLKEDRKDVWNCHAVPVLGFVNAETCSSCNQPPSTDLQCLIQGLHDRFGQVILGAWRLPQTLSVFLILGS